jgi:hypothetical protein
VYTRPLEQMCRDLAWSLVLVFLCEHSYKKYRSYYVRISISVQNIRNSAFRFLSIILHFDRVEGDDIFFLNVSWTSYIPVVITLSDPQTFFKRVLLSNTG